MSELNEQLCKALKSSILAWGSYGPKYDGQKLAAAIEEIIATPAPQAAPSELHDEIMRLPADKAPAGRDAEHWYKVGHRDARHAAAELVAAHEAECPAVTQAAPGDELAELERWKVWWETWSADKPNYNRHWAALAAQEAWMARAVTQAAPSEPVAWRVREYDDGEGMHSGVWLLTQNRADVAVYERYNAIIEPLYATPAPAQQAEGDARDAALEEAAKICDGLHDQWRWPDGSSGPNDCAVAIRAAIASATTSTEGR